MEKLKQLRRSDDSVPAEWQVKKLEDFAVLQRGFDLPVQNRKEGPYPVYGSNGINGFHAQAAVKAPGVLTGRSGSIGFVFYVDEDFWPLNTTLYVKDFHDNYPPFVKLVLEALELDRFAAATGVPSLNRNFVHPLPVRVPPFDQQVEIAKVITQIARVIELTETLIAKQQRLKTGLMQKLLTKGIDEQGKLRSEATHEFKDSPLGRIPVEWDVVKVEDVGAVRLGRQRSPKHQSGRFTTPYLRVANVFDGWIDYSDILSMDFTPAEKEIYNLLPGDILLNEGQSLELVGRSAIYEGEAGQYCFQNTLVRFRSFPGNVAGFSQAVFKYWLDTGRFMDVARQTTSVAHLGADRFAQMDFALPRPEEQRRIYSVLNSQYQIIKSQQAYLHKLRRLKTGLMQDLLTGKVRVTPLLETQSRTDG